MKTELIHFSDENDLQRKLKPFEIYKIVAILPYHSGPAGCCGQATLAAAIVVYEKH